LLALALALPPTIGVIVCAASGVAALVRGQPLLWPAHSMSLTEAVAMRDTAEIVRQIALGADPNRRYDAWDVLKRGQHVTLTPLEAAIATRESYVFDLLVANGANVTPEIARTLNCFASAEHAADIATQLSKQFGPAESCAGVQLPW
jgi:hypothetical protein